MKGGRRWMREGGGEEGGRRWMSEGGGEEGGGG